MFPWLRRTFGPRFDLARIGDRWDQRPLVHDGLPGTLHVRQLPGDLPRARFGTVAMAWADAPEDATASRQRTETIQQALEASGTSLLVLWHEMPDRVTWYAYSSRASAVDAALAGLDDEALRWGTNDDPAWEEYDHARGLVGL